MKSLSIFWICTSLLCASFLAAMHASWWQIAGHVLNAAVWGMSLGARLTTRVIP